MCVLVLRAFFSSKAENQGQSTQERSWVMHTIYLYCYREAPLVEGVLLRMYVCM